MFTYVLSFLRQLRTNDLLGGVIEVTALHLDLYARLGVGETSLNAHRLQRVYNIVKKCRTYMYWCPGLAVFPL